MTPEVIDSVRRFVSRETQLAFEEVLPTTRLHSDLHLDGRRAVQFMERFSSHYRVDVEDLWKNWKQYFSTEGLTLDTIVSMVVVVVSVIAMPFAWISQTTLLLKLAICCALLLLAATVLWAKRSSSAANKTARREITVGDLVHAVHQERLRLP